MESALLVIDMLRDFLDPGAPLYVPDGQRIVSVIKEAIAKARSQGQLVVYICDRHTVDDPEIYKGLWPPHAIEGTLGSHVVAALTPHDHDPVVCKRSYSGFHGTRLDVVLKEHSIKKLVVCGLVTNICVFYTVYDAVIRGYEVSVLKDSVCGVDPDEHKFALDQMQKVLGVTLT